MLHRLAQFAGAGRRPAARDFAFARESLAPELYDLFAAQHPRDIVHAAECARWLMNRGVSNEELIMAALLHDIAKGRQRRWDRTAAVLAGGLNLSEAAGDAHSHFELRRAVQRTLDHSREGARRLQSAGAPARVVELTRLHHASPEREGMLSLLQQADAAT